MHQSAWPSYLDALETYVQRAAVAVASGKDAMGPSALASRPTELLPVEYEARVRELLTFIERLTASAMSRRGEVMAAIGAIDDRRRIGPRRVARLVDQAL